MTKWGFVIGTCVALLATTFVLFMFYGAGFKYVLLAASVWALGLPFFMLGKRERRSKLTAAEWVVSLVVLAMAIAGLIGITTGQLTL